MTSYPVVTVNMTGREWLLARGIPIRQSSVFVSALAVAAPQTYKDGVRESRVEIRDLRLRLRPA